MDTNSSHHMIDQDVLVSSARLPGEPAAPPLSEPSLLQPSPLEAGDRLPQSESTRPRRRRRSLLLGGAAIFLVGGGAVAFLVSPYNHVLPVPGLTAEVRQLAASAGVVQQPKLVAPSATLARVPLPSPASPPTRDAFRPKSHEDQVRELLALHPDVSKAALQSSFGKTTPAMPLAPAAAPSPVPSRVQPSSGLDKPYDLVVGEPGSQTTPSSGVAAAPTPPTVAGTVIAAAPDGQAPDTRKDAASPALVANAGPTAPIPVLAPALVAPLAPPTVLPTPAAPLVPARDDAVSVAQSLRAAPMTPADQVQVLDLVTQLAKMVHDLKAQDTQLRTDLRRATAEYTARLDDYGRRLALSEARSSVARAAQDDALPLGSDLPAPAPSAVMPVMTRSTPITVTAPVSQQAVNPAGLKRYRVQAASPGLAMLAEVERGGGEGAQTQVMVGDSLPDYGKVKSIAQRGTAWVVTAERGTIQ